MRLLEFLKEAKRSEIPTENGGVAVEYRLVCSGELFNRRVLTADWRKSDITRVLLFEPFELIVASAPFDDYPQELCLRFKTSSITTSKGNIHVSGLPDREIVQDLSALLTLLCRRLITVAAKIREQHPQRPEYRNVPSSLFHDWPATFLNSTKVVNWKRRPAAVTWGRHGIEKVLDYHPQPMGIDPDGLKKVLLDFPDLEYAEVIVQSARLYATALEMIESRQDISYQLLISSTEVLASTVLKSYQPDADALVDTKRTVYDLGLGFGLSAEQAREMAIAACQGIGWYGRKFRKFLADNITDELWTKDSLFIPLEHFLPKREEFNKALRRIYEMRSGASHSGESYPLTATLGTSPWLPAEVMLEGMPPVSPFPPVTWFERVVNIAICNFIEQAVGLDEEIGKEVG